MPSRKFTLTLSNDPGNYASTSQVKYFDADSSKTVGSITTALSAASGFFPVPQEPEPGGASGVSVVSVLASAVIMVAGPA